MTQSCPSCRLRFTPAAAAYLVACLERGQSPQTIASLVLAFGSASSGSEGASQPRCLRRSPLRSPYLSRAECDRNRPHMRIGRSERQRGPCACGGCPRPAAPPSVRPSPNSGCSHTLLARGNSRRGHPVAVCSGRPVFVSLGRSAWSCGQRPRSPSASWCHFRWRTLSPGRSRASFAVSSPSGPRTADPSVALRLQKQQSEEL
jgi:hypothetical protein